MAHPNLFQLSLTVLEDLPIEMLECILVKAIAMEVKGLKLAKSVWKEKADPVINRLRMVCSHWSNILTTELFRMKLDRLLDQTADHTFTPEILQRCLIPDVVLKLTTLEDEIYAVCSNNGFSHVIQVYDCNNMAEVKDVIPLHNITNPWDLAACSPSSSVFLLAEEHQIFSVWLIKKVSEHQFHLSVHIVNLILNNPHLVVSANGVKIIVSSSNAASGLLISTYSGNGAFQQTISFSGVEFDLKWLEKVVQRDNGNLVLVAYVEARYLTKLIEINPVTGIMIRQFMSELQTDTEVGVIDGFGSILICDQWQARCQLLDSEFNLFELGHPQVNDVRFTYPSMLHYNIDRKELVRLPFSYFTSDSRRVMTIYRFV